MSILNITLGDFLIVGMYAMPAVFLWYMMFRYKNERSLPREVVRDTFFIGMFSVAPLLAYQYIYSNWLPQINTGSLVSGTIMQILIAFIGLGFFFVFLVGSFTIFYSLFTKDSLTNTLKAIISEPLNFGATGIIFLLILGLDLLLQTFTPFKIPTAIIGTTFILATLEEYSKHLVVRLFDDHKIKNIANAIEFSIVVALGFAFVENIFYLHGFIGTEKFQGLLIGRSIISMLGHIIFSAIFGYYYGIAKFAEPIMLVESLETSEPKLPSWIHKIFSIKSEQTFKAKKIFEGLLFAGLIHTVFNYFLQYNLLYMVIIILFLGGIAIYLMLESDIVKREFALVGTKQMPKEDFEQLIWKVSVMKHLKEIQKYNPSSKRALLRKNKKKTTLEQ